MVAPAVGVDGGSASCFSGGFGAAGCRARLPGLKNPHERSRRARVGRTQAFLRPDVLLQLQVPSLPGADTAIWAAKQLQHLPPLAWTTSLGSGVAAVQQDASSKQGQSRETSSLSSQQGDGSAQAPAPSEAQLEGSPSLEKREGEVSALPTARDRGNRVTFFPPWGRVAPQSAETSTIVPVPKGRLSGKLKAPPAPPHEATHPVLTLLRQRIADGSAPGARRDGHKLGLVVEGGGMRGAVSGGGLQALHDLGLRDIFDAVYGSSAGAINATYFLSRQREGVNIYTEDIANSTFVDLRRLLQRSKDPTTAPALDLSFLLDHVMESVKPLDWGAVLASPVPLKVVASCLDALQPVILDDFTSAVDLKTCLRASANVPEVAGTPVLHRGRRLVDAAVFEPVPFRAAIADGCTHVLVLATRPPNTAGALARAVDGLVTGAVKRAVLSPEYMRAAWAAEARHLVDGGLHMDDVLARTAHDAEAWRLPTLAGTHIFPVFPGAAAALISPVCINVELLQRGVAEGRRAINALLAPPVAAARLATAKPLAAAAAAALL